MSSLVVVREVSKRFMVEHHRPTSLRERFVRRVWRPGHSDELWALRNIGFAVEGGEVFGVLGANGSGKSTLLRLVAGVMEPSTGEIHTTGRIGALLDLAAGFHPELTGLENIALNGALLGMSPGEVRIKRDDIVDFSGLAGFIDSPVKYYSSGMLMRLGFSIAIHLDPEVLLVDEVLAVGDEEFQRRCLDRIEALRASGKSVILVTHDMAQVRLMCQHAIWLDHGEIAASGKADAVINSYMAFADRVDSEVTPPPDGSRWGSGQLSITGITIHGDPTAEDIPLTGQPCSVLIHYRALEPIDQPVFGLAIHRADGTHITGPNTSTARERLGCVQGEGVVEFIIDRLPLLPGSYVLTVAAYDRTLRHPFDHHERMYPFRVGRGDVLESEGIVSLMGSWRCREEACPPQRVPEPRE